MTPCGTHPLAQSEITTLFIMSQETPNSIFIYHGLCISSAAFQVVAKSRVFKVLSPKDPKEGPKEESSLLMSVHAVDDEVHVTEDGGVRFRLNP